MAINIKMKDNIDKIETIKIHKKILNTAENKIIIGTSPFFYEKSWLTWMIHKSRLLQMRGTGCEAVVLHREYPVTKQMQ
jgi:hypothetical protein